jgi:hypothetical protein
MMIVDAIDSAATTTITGDGGSLTAGGGGPPRPRIPTLHQPDGRRGGGGGGAATAASLSGGGYDRHRDNDGRAIAMGEGEDSSLTMARDFLSRLVSCGARIVVIFLLNLNMFILFFLLDIFPSPSHPLSSLFLWFILPSYLCSHALSFCVCCSFDWHTTFANLPNIALKIAHEHTGPFIVSGVITI